MSRGPELEADHDILFKDSAEALITIAVSDSECDALKRMLQSSYSVPNM